MKVHVLKPDVFVQAHQAWPRLFLGGSIENGKAIDWQSLAISYFQNLPSEDDIVLVNPRRDVWHSELDQTIENQEFKAQVTFELENLELCDAAVIWFQPETLSPISLQELGLLAGWASTGLLSKVVVGCPKGFWRRGNIEVICDRYHLKLVETFDEMLDEAEFLVQRNHARRLTITNHLGQELR